MKFLFQLGLCILFSLSCFAKTETSFKSYMEVFFNEDHKIPKPKDYKFYIQSYVKQSYSFGSFLMNLGTRKSLTSQKIKLLNSKSYEENFIELNQFYFKTSKKIGSRYFTAKLGRFKNHLNSPFFLSPFWDSDFYPYGLYLDYLFKTNPKNSFLNLNYQAKISLSYFTPYLDQKKLSFYSLKYNGKWKLNSSIYSLFGVGHILSPFLENTSCEKNEEILACKRFVSDLPKEDLNYKMLTQVYFGFNFLLKANRSLKTYYKYIRNKKMDSRSYTLGLSFKDKKYSIHYNYIYKDQFSHFEGLDNSDICEGLHHCKSHLTSLKI